MVRALIVKVASNLIFYPEIVAAQLVQTL